MLDIKVLFDNVEARLHELGIDEVKDLLQGTTIGYQVQTPVFDPGLFLYRGRLLEASFEKASPIQRQDLSYPPAHRTRVGRANRAGSPVFYASMTKEGVFYELPDLEPGSELVLGIWQTTARMLVNNVGYTEFAFQQLGAARSLPDWRLGRPLQAAPPTPHEVPELSEKGQEALKFELSRCFTRQAQGADSAIYKLSAAIAEMHLGEITNHNLRFSGVLYPSVGMNGNGDNIAIQPWFADDHLLFKKAIHARVTGRNGSELKVDYLDEAYEFDALGQLSWLGRRANWQLQAHQTCTATVTEGVDPWGDYERSKGGEQVHWVVRDGTTGETMPQR